MSSPAAEVELVEEDRIGPQYQFLPPTWRCADRIIVRATEIAVFAVGALFTFLISLEVLSRYVFKFSIMFVNAGSRFLLVWFFVIGAGLALRHGAHVGFELLVGRVSPGRRHAVILAAQALTMIFFIEMVWAGIYSLGPAWGQTEPGLEISLFWAFLSIPLGFALMIYHLVVLMVVEHRRSETSGVRP